MENINIIRVGGIDYTVGPAIDSSLSTSSTNPVQNRVVKNELDKKQNKLIPGDNINIDPETNIISSPNTGGGFPDAPSDNKSYVRKNNLWVEETIVDTSSFATKEEVSDTYQVKGNYATTDQLSSKQDILESGTNIKTVNGQSLLGSGNIEISGGSGGGISDAPSDGKQYARKDGNWEEVSTPDIDSKADKVTIESVSESSVELKPNKFIKFSGVASSINLTLAEEIPGIMNEYMFQFTSGSTPTTVNLPSSARWIGDHTIESDKTYIISIISNLAVIGGA